MPVTRPYNPNARRMAELVQADWKAVGVDAEIVSFEWGEYLKRTQAGDLARSCWAGRPTSPIRTTSVLLGCDAVGNATAPAGATRPMTTTIKQAKRITDLRGEHAIAKAQEIFKEEAPWVTVAHSIVFQPVRKEVVDYRIDPFGGNIFYGVDLKE